jgi:DUF438 domain-containing protein
MKTIAEFMTANHKACDHKFADAEVAALDGKWSEADAAFNAFNADMLLHFATEEDLLFPALTSAGGPSGPVQVMLMEHKQIRELLSQMAASVAQKNDSEYSGLSETLLMVMQQHNRKEENILYPIMDQMLSGEREALLGRLLTV